MFRKGPNHTLGQGCGSLGDKNLRVWNSTYDGGMAVSMRGTHSRKIKKIGVQPDQVAMPDWEGSVPMRVTICDTDVETAKMMVRER